MPITNESKSNLEVFFKQTLLTIEFSACPTVFNSKAIGRAMVFFNSEALPLTYQYVVMHRISWQTLWPITLLLCFCTWRNFFLIGRERVRTQSSLSSTTAIIDICSRPLRHRNQATFCIYQPIQNQQTSFLKVKSLELKYRLGRISRLLGAVWSNILSNNPPQKSEPNTKVHLQSM